MIHKQANNDVSIIVVNWNGERFLKDCVFLAKSYVEIILIDTALPTQKVKQLIEG